MKTIDQVLEKYLERWKYATPDDDSPTDNQLSGNENDPPRKGRGKKPAPKRGPRPFRYP